MSDASRLVLRRLNCLYVEDDIGLQKVVSVVLEDLFGEVWCASDGEQGLKLYREKHPDLVVTDIRMPGMNGIDMIREIRRTDPDQHIAVTSAYDDSEHLIPLIELGVDHFIAKPMLTDVLIDKLVSIGYRIDLEKAAADKDQAAEERLRSQIEWLTYKDNKARFSDISSEVNAIYNLKRSLNEAAGFGAMISIVRMIKSFAKPVEGDTYGIKKELLDLLFQNNAYCERLVSGLELIEKILKDKLKPAPMKAGEIVNALREDLHNALTGLAAKGHTIEIHDPGIDYSVNIDRGMVSLIVEETILNACKYSGKGPVTVHLTGASGYVCIHTRSPAPKNEKFQITKQVERLVLEPFFRLASSVEGYSELEKFPVGLGLSIVNYVAQKSGGFFSISTVLDHTQNPPALCTSAQIFFPILA